MTAAEAQAAGFLPFRANQYVPLFDVAEARYQVPALFLMALCERETAFGTARSLDIRGPKGTGDFTPRSPKRWKYAMPPDGRGWGRGLMQIDYGANPDFMIITLPSGVKAWEDPEANVMKAAALVQRSYNAFGWALDATARAYNAGEAGTFQALQAAMQPGADRRKCLDAGTTENYVSGVMSILAGFQGVCE